MHVYVIWHYILSKSKSIFVLWLVFKGLRPAKWQREKKNKETTAANYTQQPRCESQTRVKVERERSRDKRVSELMSMCQRIAPLRVNKWELQCLTSLFKAMWGLNWGKRVPVWCHMKTSSLNKVYGTINRFLKSAAVLE